MIDRETWANSPEMRQAVQRDLTNWGRWSAGGFPQLGYPSHDVMSTPSEEDKERRLIRGAVDVDKAEQVERVLTAYARQGQRGQVMTWALMAKYVNGQQPAGISQGLRALHGIRRDAKAVEAMLDEAEWVFACLAN